MMNEREKSDEAVVPMKPVNNAKGFWSFVAERAEGRAWAKENERDQADDREEHGPAPAQADRASPPQETQRSCKRLPPCAPMGGEAMPQAGCPAALDRIRQAARRDKKLRFTNLFHHVYAADRLRQAYLELKKQAAPGIDGQTWSDYATELESNLQNLSDRLAKGRYKAPPVKRVYIPKPGGKQRPIMASRMRAKLKALKEELARRMHHGIHAMGRWLQSVLRGHVQYFGVPRNSQPLWAFRAHLTRLWKQALNRRSQRRSVTWAKMSRIAKCWLKYPRIVHPYPEERYA